LDDTVFLPRVFFHKATYAQSLQGDGSEHAAPLCEGPAQFAQFSTEKQGSTEKKKRAKKQIFKNHKKKKNAMIRRSWFWESYCSFGTLMARSSMGTLGPVAFLVLRRCVLPCPRAIMEKAACCNE